VRRPSAFLSTITDNRAVINDVVAPAPVVVPTIPYIETPILTRVWIAVPVIKIYAAVAVICRVGMMPDHNLIIMTAAEEQSTPSQ
jgi:hypothetical protein